jgi:hypothetical protein
MAPPTAREMAIFRCFTAAQTSNIPCDQTCHNYLAERLAGWPARRIAVNIAKLRDLLAAVPKLPAKRKDDRF